MRSPPPLGSRPLWDVAKNYGFYSVGSALSLVCSIVLLPVYATQFSASQFGIVATGQIVAVFVGIAARPGLSIGMFRYLVTYHIDGDSRSAVAIVTTCLAASLLSGAVAAGIMLIAVTALGSRLGADVTAAGVLIALNLLVSAAREISEFVLRATGRARPYVVLSSSFLLISTLMTVILVVPLHTGVAGAFASLLIANGVTGIFGLYAIRKQLNLTCLSMHELRLALQFGIPSVPALMADWVTQYSDRFFLTRFSGIAQVGIYSLGYRIGMIEQQVVGTATQAAWDPFVLSHFRRPDGPRLIATLATGFAIVGMAVVVLISASAPGLLAASHAKAEYSGAAAVVFPIALANFFAVLQYLFLAPTSIRLRPGVGTLLRAAAAALNIALNIALIPQFAAAGAAWATVLTFLFACILTERVGQRLWPIPYKYGKLVLVVAGGFISQAAVSTVAQGHGAWRLAVVPLMAEAVFVAWLFVTGVVHRNDIGRMAGNLRALRRQEEAGAEERGQQAPPVVP